MHVLLLLKIKDSSNAFFHASVCVRTLFLQLGVSLKWSYLSQHSSPMTGGMEGNRDGVLRGTRGSQAGPSSSTVNVQVQEEQVEVWILNIEKLQWGSILTPMITTLKGGVGNGLRISSIPQI